MLFGTGPSGSTAGSVPSAQPYSPYSHASMASGQQQQQPASFKSLHPALMSTMLHASNPTGPTELMSSLGYHHHGHPSVESLAGGNQVGRTPSTGEPKLGTGLRESPGSHHRAQNASPSSSSGGIGQSERGNQNEVRNVMLYGVPIVSLFMDGQERLCLAQISNTLLKTFSYNEIHNRRVALGITCVQCTPVQLELLRRAGAMPVSSRRCGMITKREAERLCKSFLAEAEPPKLPDTFSFDVYHACAWGCRGSFTPSRYNSSRAKCIKCVYCGLFFSPNKFIFHSHRLPTSKYVQPDAANFNSWRRHIKLVSSPEPLEHVSYAWEDVKAMFNGGSRKRAMTTTLNSFTKNQESNSKANAARKQSLQQSKQQQYSDDNSGLEDSDEYCSLDAPQKKASGADSEVSIGSQPEEEPSPHSVSAHPYHSFAQINSKSLFENHFKKAFEVSSLIGGGGNGSQCKANEGKESHVQSPTRSSPMVPSPSKPSGEVTEPKPPAQLVSAFSPIESYLEANKSSLSPVKALPSPQSVVSPSGGYLTHSVSGEPSLMASYGGLFGSQHPFGRAHQLADPRMAAGTHPAILSSLLNGVPETAASQQLRSSLISSNYAQMAPTAGTHASSDMTSPPLLNAHASPPAGPQMDFRHNLAEFMWSMASKAGPTPYNFLWPHASIHAQVGHPQMGAQQPSSSSSSTPSLSPSQMPQGCETLNETNSSGNSGGIFAFKSASNAEDIRKALLLNSNFLQQQQRNAAASHFPPLHPNAMGMHPFLPNLIGHNLRLMPSNGAQAFTGSPLAAPNYLVGKENSDNDLSAVRRSKSPGEVMATANVASSLPGMSPPMFPFRSAFSNPATGAPLDRFNGEVLLRNQLFLDAYHNGGGNSLAGRSLFNPVLFGGDKARYEDNNSESAGEKSIDVIGGDDETQHSMFKSVYQSIPYAKANSRTSKFTSRRNLKRSLASEGKHSAKKFASLKAKTSKRKVNDNLLVLDVDSRMSAPTMEEKKRCLRPESEPKRIEGTDEPRDGEFERYSSNSQEEEGDEDVSYDAEEQRESVAGSPPEVYSKGGSPVEFVSSQSPERYVPFGSSGRQSSSPSSPRNGSKVFMLLNDAGQSSPATSSQPLQLVS